MPESTREDVAPPADTSRGVDAVNSAGSVHASCTWLPDAMWEGFDEALNAGPLCSALSRQVDLISAVCYPRVDRLLSVSTFAGPRGRVRRQCQEQGEGLLAADAQGVEDRSADAWEALLAIADLAGGHWPQTSRVAAVAAVAETLGEAPRFGVMLVRDLRIIFSRHSCLADTPSELLRNL